MTNVIRLCFGIAAAYIGFIDDASATSFTDDASAILFIDDNGITG